jgi:hypothetical protein
LVLIGFLRGSHQERLGDGSRELGSARPAAAAAAATRNRLAGSEQVLCWGVICVSAFVRVQRCECERRGGEQGESGRLFCLTSREPAGGMRKPANIRTRPARKGEGSFKFAGRSTGVRNPELDHWSAISYIFSCSSLLLLKPSRPLDSLGGGGHALFGAVVVSTVLFPLSLIILQIPPFTLGRPLVRPLASVWLLPCPPWLVLWHVQMWSAAGSGGPGSATQAGILLIYHCPRGFRASRCRVI